MSSFKEMLGLEFIKFAEENNLKKVQACLDLDVDVNTADEDGHTAAHSAALWGHGQVIRLLAATGQVDFNKVDNGDWTPLHWALVQRQYEVAVIIAKQENINFSLRTPAGNTPANLAVIGQIIPFVEILAKQENFNDWNIPDRDGFTPIMNSIRVGNSVILKILLKCPRVDPNIKDGNGDSPVMLALKEEEFAMAKILIKCPKVNLGVKDRNRSSLQKIAREKGLPEIIDMISDALNNKIERLQQENSGLYTVEKEKPELNNSILQKIPECPICFEKFKKDQRIFSCVAGHHLCGSCKAKKIKRCPVCMRAYGEDIRARDFEKLVGELWG